MTAERDNPGEKRAILIIGALLIAALLLRVIFHYQRSPSLPTAAGLLAGFSLLFATAFTLLERFPHYAFLYFPLETGLILASSLLHPHLDMWVTLYILLSLQAFNILARPAAAALSTAWAVLLLTSEILSLGWSEGLPLGLVIIAAGTFFASYVFFYGQVEAARLESQALLAELQAIHERSKEYAGQAEALAAAQERNRLARELHDSVSQLIFSITLTAEAARLLLKKDPPRVGEQLERLQALTGQALSQLRALIQQWRPS